MVSVAPDVGTQDTCFSTSGGYLPPEQLYFQRLIPRPPYQRISRHFRHHLVLSGMCAYGADAHAALLDRAPSPTVEQCVGYTLHRKGGG